MQVRQTCARWGCKKTATYDKPLCYLHWREYEEYDLIECERCHWVCDGGDFVLFDIYELEEEFPILCDACLPTALLELGRPWQGVKSEQRPVLAHAPLVRPRRFIYVLKLADNSFYVGQTIDLVIRLQEHRDGQQHNTKGKNPKLIYFESFIGERNMVDKREAELTQMCRSPVGRRHLRQIIENWREPLRLADLEA